MEVPSQSKEPSHEDLDISMDAVEQMTPLGAEASACRDALDLSEYTRATLCEVLDDSVAPVDLEQKDWWQ